MPEIEFARDTLEYVKLFMRMGVTDSWLYRMLIGRMYYAAHHLGRRLLIEIGLQPNQWRDNVHQRVIEELNANYAFGGKMGRESVSALGRLRGMRRTADYDLTIPVRRRDVNHALSLLTQITTEFERVVEVG